MAQVELTSEDAAFPIEAALVPGVGFESGAPPADQGVFAPFGISAAIADVRVRFRPDARRGYERIRENIGGLTVENSDYRRVL